MTQLTKQSLQDFIDKYITNLNELELEWCYPEYLDGVKDTLSDLESEFITDNLTIPQLDNEPIKGTVLLKSGEELKIPIDYLADFLHDNSNLIQTRKFTRRGPMRDNPCNLIALGEQQIGTTFEVKPFNEMKVGINKV